MVRVHGGREEVAQQLRADIKIYKQETEEQSQNDLVFWKLRARP